MTIEPCPFCAAKFGDKSGPLDFDGQGGEKPHQIYCWGCGAQSKLFATPQEAIAAWNRRAAAAGSEGLSAPQDTKSNPSNGLVERLRELAAEDEMLLTLPWPSIKKAFLAAADEIERLQRAQGVLSSQRGDADLLGALREISRCLLPIHMGMCEAEMIGEPIPDSAVVLSFMGSGASDNVTAGEVRRALDRANSALSAAPATPIGGLSLGVEGDQGVSVAGLPAPVAEATATDAQHSAGKGKP